jgi:dTDP-glucose pyrophosphorylase
MIIVIPIGGNGQRFKDANYTHPKPLINVLGKPMIYWVMDALRLDNKDKLLIVYQSELDIYNFKCNTVKRYPEYNIYFTVLDEPTRGAMETVYNGLVKNPELDISEGVTIMDCDTFYDIDICSIIRDKYQSNNAIFYFKDVQKNPIYSYITIENNIVKDVKEKIKCSDNANTGVYVIKDFLSYYKMYVDTVNTDGEMYISNLYKFLLKHNQTVYAHQISKDNVYCLGTPVQVIIFCSSEIHQTKKKFLFDKDSRDLSIIKYLQSKGHEVSLNCIDDKLDGFIPDFYISKCGGIHPDSDLEKELGYTIVDIQCRNFNTITQIDKTIHKTSTKNLDGEIYWYLNIPESVKDLFPCFYSYDNSIISSYVVEKINGVPLSYLYVNQHLTKYHLDVVLDEITRIHKCGTEPDVSEDFINHFYLEKLYDRCLDNIYKETLLLILDKFTAEIQYPIKIVPVHGDPVFGNILWTLNGQIKFIDMRGKIGNTTTIYGDIYYDYAKIYQSLIGYDNILSGKKMNHNFSSPLIHHFEKRFSKKDMDKISIITASLLFSLIPLHLESPSKCELYHQLCLDVLKDI